MPGTGPGGTRPRLRRTEPAGRARSGAKAVVGEGWHQRYGEAWRSTLWRQRARRPRSDAVRNAGTVLSPRQDAALHRRASALGSRSWRQCVIPSRKLPGKRSSPETAGVEVEIGLCEADASANGPYLKLRRRSAYVHAKWAMSLDGKIASGPAFAVDQQRRISQTRSRASRAWTRSSSDRHGLPTTLLTARPPTRAERCESSSIAPAACPSIRSSYVPANEVPCWWLSPDRAAAAKQSLQRRGCECAATPARRTPSSGPLDGFGAR